MALVCAVGVLLSIVMLCEAKPEPRDDEQNEPPLWVIPRWTKSQPGGTSLHVQYLDRNISVGQRDAIYHLEFEPSRASSLMWLADVKSNLDVVYGPPALKLEEAELGTTLAQFHAWTPVPALFLGSMSCRPLPGWNTAGDCYERRTTAQVIHRPVLSRVVTKRHCDPLAHGIPSNMSASETLMDRDQATCVQLVLDQDKRNHLQLDFQIPPVTLAPARADPDRFWITLHVSGSCQSPGLTIFTQAPSNRLQECKMRERVPGSCGFECKRSEAASDWVYMRLERPAGWNWTVPLPVALCEAVYGWVEAEQAPQIDPVRDDPPFPDLPLIGGN